MLTHGDLNTANIMVPDGHVSGIIDWEHAGYYPDWWEYVNADRYIEEPEWQYYVQREMVERLGFGKHQDAATLVEKFHDHYHGPPRGWKPHVQFEKFCDCKPY